MERCIREGEVKNLIVGFEHKNRGTRRNGNRGGRTDPKNKRKRMIPKTQAGL